MSVLEVLHAEIKDELENLKKLLTEAKEIKQKEIRL